MKPIFYTSGRTSNESPAFLFQLFVRAFGTNNLPDCSNMCHESTSVALPPMLGIREGLRVKLHDFDIAEGDFYHRPKSRHQSSAHVDGVAESQGKPLQNCQRQSHAGDGAFSFQESAGLAAPDAHSAFSFQRRHTVVRLVAAGDDQWRHGFHAGVDESHAGSRGPATRKNFRPRFYQASHGGLRKVNRPTALGVMGGHHRRLRFVAGTNPASRANRHERAQNNRLLVHGVDAA